MAEFNIWVETANPVLERLIDEQLATLKHVIRDKDSSPDGIICDQNMPINSFSGALRLDIPKGAVRLGEILDRLGYLLSGREFHLEDDLQTFVMGDMTLLPSENILQHNLTNHILHLTDKERLLLRYLYEAGQEGIGRKELLKAIWGYADDAETHTLETHVYRLRQKLEAWNEQDLVRVIDGKYKLDIKKPTQ